MKNWGGGGGDGFHVGRREGEGGIKPVLVSLRVIRLKRWMVEVVPLSALSQKQYDWRQCIVLELVPLKI